MKIVTSLFIVYCWIFRPNSLWSYMKRFQANLIETLTHRGFQIRTSVNIWSTRSIIIRIRTGLRSAQFVQPCQTERDGHKLGLVHGWVTSTRLWYRRHVGRQAKLLAAPLTEISLLFRVLPPIGYRGGKPRFSALAGYVRDFSTTLARWTESLGRIFLVMMKNGRRDELEFTPDQTFRTMFYLWQSLR